MKLKLKNSQPPQNIDPNARKIIFAHKRAMGDAVMFSAGVRDFALLFPQIRINVDCNQPYVFDNNPYLDRSLKKGQEGVEYYKVGYPAIGSCNNTNVHFTQMFLLDMIAVADAAQPLPISLGEFCATFANGTVGDPTLSNLEKNPTDAREPFIGWRNKYVNLCTKYSRLRGDLHLTNEEKQRSLVKEHYGAARYWLIAPGGKRDGTTKIWDWRRFQQVVDHYTGCIQFVAVGKSDLIVEKLRGVIDLVDKFNDNPRPLFSLVYHAEGIVSGPSVFMHLAAAFNGTNGRYKPCVVILGGREPSAWIHYSGQQILHTTGAWSCCAEGGCWKSRTHPLPKDPKSNKSLCQFPLRCDGKLIQGCMDSITAQDVIRAIDRYYEGDLLSFSKSGDSEENAVKWEISHPIGPIGDTPQAITTVNTDNVKGHVIAMPANGYADTRVLDAEENEQLPPMLPIEEAEEINRIEDSVVKAETDDEVTEQLDAEWDEAERIVNEDDKGVGGSAPVLGKSKMGKKKRKYDESESNKNKEIDEIHGHEISINNKKIKQINLLGNLNSAGGGEQSLCTIAQMLQRAGWEVYLFPVGSVHKNYRSNGLPIVDAAFETGAMIEYMIPDAPLLFYGNDTVRKFAEQAEGVVAKSSAVVIGINYMNGPLPKCDWLARSGKLRAVIFQNEEKLQEFRRDQLGFSSTRLISLYGAIDLNRFLEACPPQREKGESLVVLKHCVADYRKYITTDSEGKGQKIHIWQQHLHKDRDVKFYGRLLKDVPEVRFEFMEAHKELAQEFKGEKRMVFHKWDSMPVEEFLSHGHVYLYRTSNLWRDQYPRTVAEALAVGLPVLSEPRDGTRDRIVYGDTGFYCVDYDGFKYALKLLLRKEGYRQRMSRNCKDWARTNLDPRRWVDLLEEILMEPVNRLPFYENAIVGIDESRKMMGLPPVEEILEHETDAITVPK